MNVSLNQEVKTPMGDGIVRGYFAIESADTGEEITKGISVRLPVNDITRPHLAEPSCMTPRATEYGVWVFPEADLSPV